MEIRRARRADLEAVTEIYNLEVVSATSTFDTEPREGRAAEVWFNEHSSDSFPLIVAEDGGAVVGWASLSPWSNRGAYAGTVEGSLFVAADHRVDCRVRWRDFEWKVLAHPRSRLRKGETVYLRLDPEHTLALRR